MGKKVVYIEGTSETDNGSLRNAFSKLFEKELKGKMPRVIMGDGIEQTIDKFLTKPLTDNEQRYLLVDSDKPISNNAKWHIVNDFNNRDVNKKIEATNENVFFMVQEAEAWILSQPQVCERTGLKIGKSFPKCQAYEISNPSLVLSNVYKQSGRKYHKVRDFVKLFSMLDTRQLKKDFEEFRSLIEVLQK